MSIPRGILNYSSLLRQINTKEIIINHKGTRIVNITRITDNELGKFRLNFSRCGNGDVATLNPSGDSIWHKELAVSLRCCFDFECPISNFHSQLRHVVVPLSQRHGKGGVLNSLLVGELTEKEPLSTVARSNMEHYLSRSHMYYVF